jgi:alkylated DNA repair dioxygenase AlkB
LDTLAAYFKLPFGSLLIGMYRSHQDSTGSHSDEDSAQLGTDPNVVTLSLGDSRVFRMAQTGDKQRADFCESFDIQLQHGDFLHMTSGMKQYFAIIAKYIRDTTHL